MHANREKWVLVEESTQKRAFKETYPSESAAVQKAQQLNESANQKKPETILVPKKVLEG